MQKRLCISNISYSVDENDLEDLFSEYGDVIESTIAIDRMTMESRGFGFITYNNESEAKNAILKLNGHFFKGRVLHVKFAEEKTRQYSSAPYRSPEFVQVIAPSSSRIRVWTPSDNKKRESTNQNQFKRRQRREKVVRMGE